MARKTLGNSLWLQASYVYSSLRGNYDGGVNEGIYGQTNPGWNEDFDYPALLAQRLRDPCPGSAESLPLRRLLGDAVAALRRPADVRRVGRAAEQNRILQLLLRVDVFLVPRGSAGRLPTLWEANLTLSYPIAIGPVTVTLQAYLFNLFNKQIAISRDDGWSTTTPPADFPATIYDPNQEQNNPKTMERSPVATDPRSFRAAVRVSF